MYSLELSDILRSAVQPLCKFRQFCDAKDFTDKGLHKGSLFTWNVYNDIATQGTTLIETSTIAETNFTISQGTGTVVEMGNSVPYTGLLDNLSKHPVQEIINKVLKNDCRKAMDGQAWAQFAATPLKVTAAGAATAGTSTSAVTLTTNGTATLTNSVAFTNLHVKAIVDTMKERNIPPYAGDDYFAIAFPTSFRTMKNQLEGVYQYRTEGFNMIMSGEIGRYEGVRFIEQTNIPKGNYDGSGPYTSSNFVPWANGMSDWIFFFGEDTVAEAIVVPEEIRGKIPSDYGRSKGISWYYTGGFSLVQTQPSQARILQWSSAG